MGRDDDELPPVEVLGATPEISSLQQVSTGRSGHPRGRRGRGLIAAAAVVGVLVVGAMLGGGDDEGAPAEREEETTTTRSRPSTTRPRPTTTTTLVSGPLFAGHDIPGWVLSGGPSGWMLLDVATGARLEHSLPFDDPYSTRAMTGGVVMIFNGEARFYDLAIAAQASVPAGSVEPPSLGPAAQTLGTVDGDKIWLFEGSGEPGAEGRARLVDLSGRELRRVQVPFGPYSSMLATTPEGVLFGRGGRVFFATEHGTDVVATGDLVGAVGSSVLVFSCDDDAADCGIDLRTTAGRRLRRLALERWAPDAGWQVTSARDGRFALIVHDSTAGDSAQVALFEPDGTKRASVDAGGYLGEGVSWLPGDAGLIGARNDRLAWIHETADGWAVDNIPETSSIEALGVLHVPAP